MKFLNRSGLSVRPREPFRNWLEGFVGDELPSLELLRTEATLYLIDEVDEEQDFARSIDRHWLAIFQNELEAWDESAVHWPAQLTPELFEAWFELDVQLMSFDLSSDPLLRASADS